VAKGLGSFVVGTAELRRLPGHPRPVSVSGSLAGLALSESWIPDDAEVTADLQLEVVADGHLTATGVVRAPWQGWCRRCLQAVHDEIEADVKEVFEPSPTDDADTYPLGADRVDLEPMLRDTLLLALPIAPLCRDDCQGPDPEEHPVAVDDENGGDEAEAAPDPRWAALGDLRFD
jgi:uncharacterized protein